MSTTSPVATTSSEPAASDPERITTTNQRDTIVRRLSEVELVSIAPTAPLRTQRKTFSKSKRWHAWEQIKTDDAAALFGNTLRTEALVRAAEVGMWHPNNPRHKTLLQVLATNIKGVPPGGAVQCLKQLLTRYPVVFTTAERQSAAGVATRMGRVECAAVLLAT